MYDKFEKISKEISTLNLDLYVNVQDIEQSIPLRHSYSFDEKYGNLDLSDEQLEKIIKKETRKPFY